MNGNIQADNVKDYAIQHGAEVVGILAKRDLPLSVPSRAPDRLLSQAESIIVYGIPISLGSISSSAEIATAHTRTIYTELDRIGYMTNVHLEKEGFLAVTIPSFWPIEMSKTTKGLAGDLSLKHAAVAAGLGVWGRSRLVINPVFGPRMKYGAVITNACIKSDVPLDEDFCDDCSECIAACPSQAISFDMKVDTSKCMRYFLKNGLPDFSRFLINLFDKPLSEKQEMIRSPLFWNLYQYLAVGLAYNCSECIKACPVGKPNLKRI